MRQMPDKPSDLLLSWLAIATPIVVVYAVLYYLVFVRWQ